MNWKENSRAGCRNPRIRIYESIPSLAGTAPGSANCEKAPCFWIRSSALLPYLQNNKLPPLPPSRFLARIPVLLALFLDLLVRINSLTFIYLRSLNQSDFLRNRHGFCRPFARIKMSSFGDMKPSTDVVRKRQQNKITFDPIQVANI
jgi:hypothetical protein